MIPIIYIVHFHACSNNIKPPYFHNQTQTCTLIALCLHTGITTHWWKIIFETHPRHRDTRGSSTASMPIRASMGTRRTPLNKHLREPSLLVISATPIHSKRGDTARRRKRGQNQFHFSTRVLTLWRLKPRFLGAYSRWLFMFSSL